MAELSEGAPFNGDGDDSRVLPPSSLELPTELAPTRSHPGPAPFLSAPGETEPDRRRYGNAPRVVWEPPEKLGLMMLAVSNGITETSRRHQVPRKTLTDWLSDFGGTARVREFLQDMTYAAFLSAERALHALVQRRAEAGEIHTEELLTTYRRLVDARLGMAQLEMERAGRPAAAQAAAQVTVTVKGDGSEPEVIEVHQ